MYPQPVIDFANEVLFIITDESTGNPSFFREHSLDNIELANKVTIEVLCKHGLELFIEQGSSDLAFRNEQEAMDVLNTIISDYTIECLIQKGLADFIENENGEEMIFLTKKGREYAQQLEARFV